MLIVGSCTCSMLQSYACSDQCSQWNSVRSISNFELWSTFMFCSNCSKDLMNFLCMNESVMRNFDHMMMLWFDWIFIHKHVKKTFFLLSLIFKGNINVSSKSIMCVSPCIATRPCNTTACSWNWIFFFLICSSIFTPATVLKVWIIITVGLNHNLWSCLHVSSTCGLKSI